jgi:DNA-binding response OmpR family regulator
MHPATTILLIEDDPAIARALSEALWREGYSVTWKSTGKEGETHARAQHPHLIILDVRLPDGSGFDLCRRLRQAGLRQPILMLTVRADEVDKVVGLEMGADDYVTKPFGVRELLSRLRALVRRTYGEFAGDANLLLVADLVIDRRRGQVTRGEQVLNLTPLEFRLLVYFAQNVGQALTRNQLLDAVWGYDYAGESDKVVNVHIRRLRQKIELDPDRPTLLLTVPGVGYRLTASPITTL